MIVEVRINEKIDALSKAFDYLVPKELENKVFLGSRVLVPLGKSERDAFVTGFKSTSKFKCKPIIKVLPSDELSEDRVQLAEKMSKRYFCNFSECIKLMINPELNKKVGKVIKDKKQNRYVISSKYLSSNYEMEEFVNLVLLEKEKYDINLYNANLKSNSKNNSKNDLKEIDKEKIYDYMLKIFDEISKNKNLTCKEYSKLLKLTEKQTLALIIILSFADIKSGEIKITSNTYNSVSKLSKSFINALIKKEIICAEEFDLEYLDYGFNINVSSLEEPLVLNSEQQKVYDSISKDISKSTFSENLIYGVTGSGKTEIYLQLIQKAIDMGKTAIVLVPEISLTPQITTRFNKRFGDIVSIMHSKLTPRRRYEEWKRIKEGKAKIVIGARSAIFVPIKNIGVIIVDEEHDGSYKSNNVPKYDAKEIAKYIAKFNNAALVYGSATPDISTYYNAKNGNMNLYKLTKRVKDIKMPLVKIIDLKYEKSMLSDKLIEEIKKNISKKEKTILFLNRRGHSSVIMCSECANVIECKNCNISLTYHSDIKGLKCHYCGYNRSLPKLCEECGGKIKMVGIGTQKLDEELKRLVPEIKTIRMDLDTTTASLSHEEILETFNNEDIDVLLGTQMVTKGHHFPKVTLAAVVFADSMLNMDSYNASVNAFQNIVQLIGRSGREGTGRAIIQTYNPISPVIGFAKNNNYDALYEFEIVTRKILKYPPFNDIIQIRVLSENEALALSQAKKVKESLIILKEKLIKEEKDKKDKLMSYIENSNLNENELKKYKFSLSSVEKNISSLNEMEILNETPFRINRMMNQYRYRVLIKCNLTPLIAGGIKFVISSLNNSSKFAIFADLNDPNL